MIKTGFAGNVASYGESTKDNNKELEEELCEPPGCIMDNLASTKPCSSIQTQTCPRFSRRGSSCFMEATARKRMSGQPSK